ncbi:hypothetical protein NHQ30_011257 [Ciborinia camelliae]|nr:hypothetical protein NHQ30_011257 [Ciborinia camelliae]
MSTSHRKPKHHPKGSNKRASISSSSSNPWSEWGTEEETGRPVRYRLDAGGNYEYDYDKEHFDRESGRPRIPRTPQTDSLEPIPESGQYSASRNYTSDRTVDDLAKSFSQTSLGHTGPPTSFNATSIPSISGARAENNPVRRIQTADPNTSTEGIDHSMLLINTLSNKS